MLTFLRFYLQRGCQICIGRVFVMSVMLLSFEAQAAPLAHTHPAIFLTTTNATLIGVAVPNGAASMAWFDWGVRGGYTSTTLQTNVGSGSTVVRVSTVISNLLPQEVYQCRLVVSNSSGVKYGSIQLFTTGSRMTIWGAGDYNFTQVPAGIGQIVRAFTGGAQTHVLKADGSVASWGYNDYGQINIPVTATNVIALAGGESHTLALRQNGTVLAWGNNQYGRANVPGSLVNVVMIGAGAWHSMALKSDGKVVCWGRNNYGQTNSSSLVNIVAVAAGRYHNAALKADGTVAAWGWNGNGQTNVPAGLNNVVMVACGYAHNLALRADGTVVAWGWNNYGQTNVPVGLSNVISIVAGNQHSLALKSDGTLVAWGDSSYGATTIPPGLSNVMQIAGGYSHNVSLGGNLPPTAQGQAVSGGANSDLVVKLEGADPNGDIVTHRIVSLPAAGELFQFANGLRGAAIVSSNTMINDALGRVIFAPVTNDYGDPYASFSFLVNDGDADSAVATVTVAIDRNHYVATQPATEIRPTTAKINGMGLAGGFPSVAWFEWGERGGFGQTTLPEAIGGGSVVRVTAAVSNLVEGFTYQFRLNISNAFGLKQGGVRLFTTGTRLAAWGDKSHDKSTPLPGLTNVVAADGYEGQTVVLRSDGTVVAWGSVANAPADLTNVVMVGAGYYHNSALRADGTVAVWGANDLGQSNVPADLTNAVIISSGYAHNVALRSDGTVTAWGYNGDGQTTVPAGLKNVMAVGAGFFHSMAIRADGTVVAWGGNQYGQTNVPVDLRDVVDLTSKWNFSLALRSNGTVVAWGQTYDAEVPPGLSNVMAIACGSGNGLALKADGTISTWGYNQLGRNDVPPGLTNASAIAAGASHSLALGNVVPWANERSVTGPVNQDLVISLSGYDNNKDVLGFRIVTLPATGTLYQFLGGVRGAEINITNTVVSDLEGRLIFAPLTNDFASPYTTFDYLANDGLLDSAPARVTINVQQSRAFTQSPDDIHADRASLHGVALPNSFDSTAWFEWGVRGNFNGTTTPVPVGNGYGIVRISTTVSNLVAGGVYQCRLVVSNVNSLTRGATKFFTTGGKVHVWGNNYAGQLDVPASLSNAVAIASGGTHCLALRENGNVTAWGWNYYNNYGQTNIPAGLTNIISLAAGGRHSLVLRRDGTVVAWGDNSYGQTNLPPGLTNVIALASDSSHSLALHESGHVSAWGGYDASAITLPDGLSNVVAIAAGSFHSLALKADGTVVAWGANGYGQTSVPVTLQNVVAISGGNSHSLALLSNGTVVVWGQHSNNGEGTATGPIPPPSGFTNGVDISSGYTHSLALQSDGSIFAWGYDQNNETTAPVYLVEAAIIDAGTSVNLALGGHWRPDVYPFQITSPANRDAEIELIAFDNDGDALTYRVASLPAVGTLYQYAGGSRGAAITASNTPVSDVGRRLIFAPFANQFGDPYSAFNFVANDGNLDSMPASVTLIIEPPMPAVITNFSRSTNGTFQMIFTGDSNTTYCISASTNLTNWEYLGLSSQTSPGLFQSLNLPAGDFPQRFYRVSTGCGTPPPLLSNLSGLTNGAFEIRFTGGNYWTYRVMTSTNLMFWEYLGAAQEFAPGQFRYLDTGMTNLPRRFYRAVAP